MGVREFYESNADFKLYVDRYCKTYRLDADTALTHELVRQVYLQYKEMAARIPAEKAETLNGLNYS